MRRFGIVGAGGYGREVMPVAAQMLSVAMRPDEFELVFVVEGAQGGPVNGYPVLDMAEFLADTQPRSFNIAIADHGARRRIADLLAGHGIDPFAVVAGNSVSLACNDVGPGAILSPFTTLTSNIRIGRFFHANLYSYVGHDCTIGDFVTFGPNVHCNGRVTIEDDVYVGTGAIIRPGSGDRPIVLGKGATIGMGAVVTRSVAAGEVVVGNPAAALPPKRPPPRVDGPE